MKTYTARYQSGAILFEKKPASEMYNLMPAGSKIIGGDVNGFSKATFQLPDGTRITLTEDDEKNSNA